jgi:hypothetical protein
MYHTVALTSTDPLGIRALGRGTTGYKRISDTKECSMQTPTHSYDGWIGRNAYDSAGEKIGEITDIFYDDRTGRPEWVTIKTGLFKGNTFVPIHGSQLHDGGDEDDEDSLRLAFTKDVVKDAPRVDADSDHLSPTEEQELWSYYGYDYNADPKLKTYGYGTNYTKNRADKDYTFERPRSEVGAIGDVGTRERGEVEAETTIHNEEARVVSQPETVRLRKYQRTEMVPVTKEEVRVERTSETGEVTTEEVRGRSTQARS